MFKTGLHLYLLMMSLMSYAQIKYADGNGAIANGGRARYFAMSVGASVSTFGDFATSPFFYKGVPKAFLIAGTKARQGNEFVTGASLITGKFRGSYNGGENVSKVTAVSLFHSRLYPVSRRDFGKWDMKAGGELNLSANYRYNPFLENNAVGAEIFPRLYGSFKVTRDISRTEIERKQFLFFKYVQPRHRNISFRMNVGVINSAYRNGYAYIGQGAILNKRKLFDGYKFQALKGSALSSELAYTIWLKDKNGIRVVYEWGAYKTGGGFDKFEMAQHTLRLVLLCNTSDK